MADVVATISSRPAFGVAGALMGGSYIIRPQQRATLLVRLLARRLRAQRDIVTAELLDDREQPSVEEADLEQHQERQRAVDAVRQRVEDRDREVEAEPQFDQRL